MMFRIAAVLVGLLPFLLLEGALRLFDVGKPTEQADPLAGFSKKLPFFERKGEVYRTVRSRLPIFNPQEFKAEKPTNGFRAFCFGGSTIYGHPYVADTAMPKWLELELQANHPDRAIEVVNSGGVSYASYRLALVLKEVLQYKPDLVVIATGENEFLEDRTYHSVKTRTETRRQVEDAAFSLRTVMVARKLFGRDTAAPLAVGAEGASAELPTEVKPRLDDSLTGYASYKRDEAWKRQVIEQFEDSMRGMIADCRAAKVPVVLVTLGSNLRDCAPYKSEHKAGLSSEMEAKWQVFYDDATSAEMYDLPKAVELYRKAAAIDDEYALLNFHLARCHDRLGQTDLAREQYTRAKDNDICPLRMLEEVYQLQYRIAGETETPLVDLRKMLEQRSPDGIPGNNIYLDHVHPALVGDQLMARGVAEQVRERGWLSGGLAWSEPARRAAYQRHFESLDVNYLGNGRRRVGWLENWAKRGRVAGESSTNDPRALFDEGLRVLEFDARDEAWKSFEEAWKLTNTVPAKLLTHIADLEAQGRLELAQDLLRRLDGRVADPEVKAKVRQALSERVTN